MQRWMITADGPEAFLHVQKPPENDFLIFLDEADIMTRTSYNKWRSGA
jgi:hypothetical protein